jgi:hypothetical protein
MSKSSPNSILINKSWAWWYTPVIPAPLGNVIRRIMVQAGLGKSKTLFQNKESKKTKCVAQMVEYLTLQFKALSSNPTATKKEKKIHTHIQHIHIHTYIHMLKEYTCVNAYLVFVQFPIT